jgi:tRNA (cytosine38-C5)-methyltransferase
MSKRHHTITYVEFYAGIGGWTMALHEALQRCDGAAALSLQRLAALDHSDLCLSVLQHNLPDSSETGKKRKRAQTAAIERVTLSLAEEWNADVWAMSPPCQPHTRQHSNQREELKDPRSKSFLHLCDLLEAMSQGTLPRLLLLENVVGFESVGGPCLMIVLRLPFTMRLSNHAVSPHNSLKAVRDGDMSCRSVNMTLGIFI